VHFQDCLHFYNIHIFVIPGLFHNHVLVKTMIDINLFPSVVFKATTDHTNC